MKSFASFFLLIFLTSTLQVVAVPWASEGFDYDLADPIAGKNEGSGWTTAWSDLGAVPDTIISGLEYPGLQTTGGALKLTIASQDQRDFNIIDATNGEVTWVSFLVRSDNLNFSFNDIFYLALRPNDSRPSPAFGVFYNPDTEKNVWGIGNQGTGDTTPVYSNVEFLTSTTYLVVGSITWDTASGAPETVRMFLNPNPTTAPDAASAIAVRSMQIGTNATTSNRIRRIYISAGNSTADSQWTIDEIRIAKEFGDVVQLPEPTAASLTIIGALLALSNRRKRSGNG